jgi:predicted RNA-binding Zn-ribbon protein involved in translation (DUF1610 family)
MQQNHPKQCALCSDRALMGGTQQQFVSYYCGHLFCERHASALFIEAHKLAEFDAIDRCVDQVVSYRCPVCGMKFGVSKGDNKFSQKVFANN